MIIWRHHADDGVRLIVEQNFAANDVAIGGVTAGPQFRAENDDVVVARLFVGGLQRPAQNRRDPEKREETGGDHRPADPLRPVAIGEARLFSARGGHVGKDVVLRRVIEVVRRRVGAARLARAARRRMQHHDFFRIGIRQRTKQHAIDHAEDGGRAGDAEREGDERRESEARIFQQHPEAVAKIVEERVHDYSDAERDDWD